MSFKATLNLGDKKFTCVTAFYQLHQRIDLNTFKPTFDTKCPGIRVSVESSEDHSLAEWASQNYEQKDGSIVFNKNDEEGKMKDISFRGAMVSEFSESFGSGTMMMEMLIIPQYFTVGNGEIANWGDDIGK